MLTKKKNEIIELDNSALKSILAPINIISLKNLLESWNFEVNDDDLDSKVALFISVVGNKLELGKYQELFLLREMSSVLKTRNWKIYKSEPPSIETDHIDQLEDALMVELKQLNYENVNVNVFNIKELGVYIIIDLPTAPRVVEELNFNFQVYQPIERLRFLFNTDGYVQISVVSEVKRQKFVKILEDILDVKIAPVQVYSYVIRDFIYKMTPIRKLTVVCPREMGGFSGVEKITVEGPDVVNGMEDLRSRQEILFNFQGLSKLGAWTTVKSDKAKMNVYGDISIKDKDTKEKIFKFIE